MVVQEVGEGKHGVKRRNLPKNTVIEKKEEDEVDWPNDQTADTGQL